MQHDIVLCVVYAQDVQQFGKSHVVGVVHHLGDIGLVGTQPFGHIAQRKSRLEVELFLLHQLLEAAHQAVFAPGIRRYVEDGVRDGGFALRFAPFPGVQFAGYADLGFYPPLRLRVGVFNQVFEHRFDGLLLALPIIIEAHQVADVLERNGLPGAQQREKTDAENSHGHIDGQQGGEPQVPVQVALEEENLEHIDQRDARQGDQLDLQHIHGTTFKEEPVDVAERVFSPPAEDDDVKKHVDHLHAEHHAHDDVGPYIITVDEPALVLRKRGKAVGIHISGHSDDFLGAYDTHQKGGNRKHHRRDGNPQELRALVTLLPHQPPDVEEHRRNQRRRHQLIGERKPDVNLGRSMDGRKVAVNHKEEHGRQRHHQIGRKDVCPVRKQALEDGPEQANHERREDQQVVQHFKLLLDYPRIINKLN